VEGIAASSLGVPLDHAWLTDDLKRAIDPTWTPRRRREWSQVKGSKSSPGCEGSYLGIPFDEGFVRAAALRTGMAGIFASDDYGLIAEILRDGFPDGAILSLESPGQPVPRDVD
jgi:hypothetical protein